MYTSPQLNVHIYLYFNNIVPLVILCIVPHLYWAGGVAHLALALSLCFLFKNVLLCQLCIASATMRLSHRILQCVCVCVCVCVYVSVCVCVSLSVCVCVC